MLLQAAVEEGIVPGGGVALLYASKTLEEVKSKNASFDQKIGVDIVMKALQMPLKTIANNAGAPTLLCCAVLLMWPAMPRKLGGYMFRKRTPAGLGSTEWW